MNKNLKNSFQTNLSNAKTPYSLSISFPKSIEKGDYLEINQFRTYRDSMLKIIDAAQINNSFLEIRNLISSLRDEAIDSNTLPTPNAKTFYPPKVTSPSVLGSPFSNINESNYGSPPNLSKSPVNVSRIKGKKPHKDQVSKLLTNLHIYLNNNLNEINEIKSIIKASSLERPAMPKIDLHDGAGENKSGPPKQENTNEVTTTTTEDPVLVAQKKLHKLQVEKLLAKIKTFNEKDVKLQEKIRELRNMRGNILQTLERGCIAVNTRISGFINEEVWNNESDKKRFFSKLIYESYIVLISKKCLLFFKSLSDQRESILLENSSILEVSYFLKESALDLNSSFFTENESNYDDVLSLNDSTFNGFQLKLEDKNFLFMRISNITDMLKLDGFFFLLNASKHNSNNLELLFKFAKAVNSSSMLIANNPINVNNENCSPSLKKGQASPSMTDLDLSNISNLPSERKTSIANPNENSRTKKRSIFGKSQLGGDNLNRKLKTTTFIEIPGIGMDQSLNNLHSKGKPAEMIQTTILQKSEFSKLNKKHTGSEKKEGEWKYLKAIKILRNGFIFLKYGTHNESHERLVFLGNEANALEWRDLSKKKSNGSIEILSITEIKEDERRNVKKPTQNTGNKENLYFTIVGKNVALSFEAGTERAKKEFISSVKILMERKE